MMMGTLRSTGMIVVCLLQYFSLIFLLTRNASKFTYLHPGYTEIVPIPCNVVTLAPPLPGFVSVTRASTAFWFSTPDYDSSNLHGHSPSFSVSPVSIYIWA